MERDEIEKLLNETGEMINQLMFTNIETWAVHREAIERVCASQDIRALQAMHENLKVRLMSVNN